jgi:hypothetical protein
MTKKKQRASGAQHGDPSSAQHGDSLNLHGPLRAGCNNEVTGR